MPSPGDSAGDPGNHIPGGYAGRRALPARCSRRAAIMIRMTAAAANMALPMRSTGELPRKTEG